jgi:hypothetical protein
LVRAALIPQAHLHGCAASADFIEPHLDIPGRAKMTGTDIRKPSGIIAFEDQASASAEVTPACVQLLKPHCAHWDVDQATRQKRDIVGFALVESLDIGTDRSRSAWNMDQHVRRIVHGCDAVAPRQELLRYPAYTTAHLQYRRAGGYFAFDQLDFAAIGKLKIEVYGAAVIGDGPGTGSSISKA